MMLARASSPVADLRLDDLYSRRAAFAQSVITGLSRQPRILSCRYLYDAAGSALFDQLSELDEYYLTRAEAEILAVNAARIRNHTGACSLVELGAGSATKTRLLLRSWLSKGASRYIPIDISADHLDASCGQLQREFPSLQI